MQRRSYPADDARDALWAARRPLTWRWAPLPAAVTALNRRSRDAAGHRSTRWDRTAAGSEPGQRRSAETGKGRETLQRPCRDAAERR